VSFFEKLNALPPDPILGLTEAFRSDPREEKINLGVGIYYSEELKPVYPKAVADAEKELVELPKTYLPIDGDPDFAEAVAALLFGDQRPSQLYMSQAVGGTGGLRVAGELIAGPMGIDRIYLPDPTWANHRPIFVASHLRVESYPHDEGEIDLSSVAEGSAVLFHPCCHNPSGFDPSNKRWEEIAEQIEQKRLLPLFDCAYHGLGGGFEEDAFAPRLFAKRGIEFLFVYSFSKNMGLYGERVGTLFASFKADKLEAVRSQVRVLIRRLYSNPPAHGARIARDVLLHRFDQWSAQVDQMRARLDEMRRLLQEAVPTLSSLERQRGLFSLTGLSRGQVETLRDQWAIYMPGSGRINVTGLTRSNLPRVAEAITAVL